MGGRIFMVVKHQWLTLYVHSSMSLFYKLVTISHLLLLSSSFLFLLVLLLFQRYLSTCSSVDLSNFKLVNNQLRSLIRNLRKDYEKKLVQGVKSRPKAFWQYINQEQKYALMLLSWFPLMVL